MNEFPTPTIGKNREFTNTRWSQVTRAGHDPNSPEGAAALEWLCQRYWYPLYVFARRHGRNPTDAQDSTQAFFLKLLDKSKLAQADPERGRFRNFLSKCFANHLKQEDVADGAKRRGGGATTVSFDALTAEERYKLEPRDPRTPEDSSFLAWITTLTCAAWQSLEAEYTASGTVERFRKLTPFLDGKEGSYAELGARIGQSEGTARVTVHRLRQRFHECFRAEVAQTASTEAELDAELLAIQRFLSGQTVSEFQ